MSDKKDILVSVCTVTYNHEKFIAQAIESVLAQKCNYRIEMIIGEDCSTDGTAAIVRSYQERYPEIIKPIFHNPNIGAAENGNTCLRACSGKYIAALEGDDYWIDANKLQIQVDFLEQNPEFTICHHNVYSEVDLKAKRWLIRNSKIDLVQDIFQLAARNTIYTASAVFKRACLNDLPDWYRDSPIGDYLIWMACAKMGKIKYMARPMAVYRVNYASSWTGQNTASQSAMYIGFMERLMADYDGEVFRILKVHRNTLVTDLLWYYSEDEQEFTRQFDHYYKDSDPETKAYLLNYFRDIINKQKLFPKGLKKTTRHLLKEVKSRFGKW